MKTAQGIFGGLLQIRLRDHDAYAVVSDYPMEGAPRPGDTLVVQILSLNNK